ncbi:MAG: dicarboxylate/amino acid:cation symporter [Treponema sp.]|uniref:dicarboxylate/amino acid:cation symporter n=1 Tax=Treponema sp. TaxID=166 RepID=UPI00298EB30B|nr:dicarboxylate/amino acid:cation symporter [Treponema sp.]MCQ2599943.1 dicarboxylate/amino acid:cation symporter [Treponema sp.]
MNKQVKQVIFWVGALIIGAVLGLLHITAIDNICNFVATIFTRLFKFTAVPAIAVSILTTLASLGGNKETGKIFRRTLMYTLLTTLAASTIAAVLFFVIKPEVLSASVYEGVAADTLSKMNSSSFLDYFVGAIPDNILYPFVSGNVLSILIVSFVFGFAISKMQESDKKTAILNVINGFQELVFKVIGWIIAILPIGIIAFTAQLINEMSAHIAMESIGKYVAVVLSGNLIQFFIVLSIFLLIRGINPAKHFKNMIPAILTALFTKSSAATLPVTMDCVENRVKCDKKFSRFILPMCTTINMNGCAAFILVTSLFVMKNGGVQLDLITVITWILISVISAVGNAGVPMGCFFLTLSLMAGKGMPIGVMGVILPIYAVIDMIETAVNIYSDSCVCAMTNKDLKNLVTEEETVA